MVRVSCALIFAKQLLSFGAARSALLGMSALREEAATLVNRIDLIEVLIGMEANRAEPHRLC